MDEDTETDIDTEVKRIGCGEVSRTCEGKLPIPEPGYHCVDGKTLCAKCPIGTYGADGKNCEPCPFGEWTIKEGESRCYSSFSYTKVGQHKSIIPFGVSHIFVSLWGAGGGGELSPQNEQFVAHAGGGGGYLSCNVEVKTVRDIIIIVGGGGKAGGSNINDGGRFCCVEAFH
jgi:hypothetical protein